MTTLLKNGYIVNVFTNRLEKANLLMNDEGLILGIGDYDTAAVIEDISGKTLLQESKWQPFRRLSVLG